MRTNRAVFVTLVICLLVMCASPPVDALDIVVNRFDDAYNLCAIDGCSLREAIKVANGNTEYDTIYLPAGRINLSRAGTGDDTNATGDLDITKSVTIVGEGPGVTIVDANFIDRVFHITNSSASVSFRMMTITAGGHFAMGAPGGGGILAEGSTVVVQHCDVVSNQTLTYPDTGSGIAVSDDGTLWLLDSSVRLNNSVTSAAVYLGGSARTGVLQIDRSTISGNHATGWASAIAYWGHTGLVRDSTISGNTHDGTDFGTILVTGTLTMEYCTLTGNTEPTVFAQAIDTQVTLTRNIIHGRCNDNGGVFVSLGGNMESPGNTCSLDAQADKRSVTNPWLYPLGDFGGPTQTHRPLPASPVVDAWFPVTVPGCTRSDQRLFSRPQNGTGSPQTRCDIGAVELILDEIFLDGFECGFTGSWSGSQD